MNLAAAPTMRRTLILSAAIALAFAGRAAAEETTPPAATLSANDLRCEYLVDPLGVDVVAPRFSWRLASQRRGDRQTAYQVLVASSADKLSPDAADKWDSGRIAADAPFNVVYAGKPLASGETCYWTVRVWDAADADAPFAPAAKFEMGLIEPSDWSAKWIATGETPRTISAPLLRKPFALASRPKRARAYVSGIGYYELYLNGRKVGDHVLDPASTYYTNDQPWPLKERTFYVAYDVTDMLRDGDNVVGAMLGNGWYTDDGKAPGRQSYGDRPKLLVQLIVEDADGKSSRIVSDETWKTSAGPITANEMCLGERYDATREQPGWNAPGFDDSSWSAAALATPPCDRLAAQMIEPCRVVATLPAVSVRESEPDVYVVDFGQHFSGWARLRVRGERGQKVRLRYVGRLLDNGRIDIRNNQAADQLDEYTLRGDGEEVWEPRFTLHGFRYVELTGFPGEPTLESLDGRQVRNDVPSAGDFACSNPMLNQLQHNVAWTLAASFQGLPQDASERPERLGWLGDTGFLVDDYFLNFNAPAFWNKHLDDIRDTQRPDGDVPINTPVHLGRVPAVGDWKAWRDAPDWEATYPIFVWAMYYYDGDERVLANHYEPLRKLVARWRTQAPDDILPSVLGDHMEPQPDGTPAYTPNNTPAELTTTCYYFRVVCMMEQIATKLGKTADAQDYAALAERIQAACTRRFYDPSTGRYATGSQASLAIPLQMDIVPEQERPRVVAALVEEIDRCGGRLSTGIMGTKGLVDALPKNGRADVMYSIATQTGYPSWGYAIERGATTIWETWEGGPTFSENMKMFGSVSKFLIEDLAGLQPAEPAWRRVTIRPGVVGDLTSATARQTTMFGGLECAWQRGDDGLALHVVVPPGATAEVHLPALGLDNPQVAEGADDVWRGGMFVAGVEGVASARRGDDAVVIEIASGTYKFSLSAGE